MSVTTILYIEDDTSNRDLIGYIVGREKNWRLLEAETGQRGIHRAAKDRPDAILLDLSLPDMNGVQVIELLQSDGRTRDIPIIAVSGDTSPATTSRMLELGCRAFLAKPIQMEEFHQAIRNALTTS